MYDIKHTWASKCKSIIHNTPPGLLIPQDSRRPDRRPASRTRMASWADRAHRSRSPPSGDCSRRRRRSTRQVEDGRCSDGRAIPTHRANAIRFVGLAHLGGRHHEDERREGAGARSEALRAGRPGGRPAAGRLAVRTAGGQAKAKILATKPEGMFHELCDAAPEITLTLTLFHLSCPQMMIIMGVIGLVIVGILVCKYSANRLMNVLHTRVRVQTAHRQFGLNRTEPHGLYFLAYRFFNIFGFVVIFRLEESTLTIIHTTKTTPIGTLLTEYRIDYVF